MEYNYYESSADGLLTGIGVDTYIIALLVSVFILVTIWRIYKKAGQPGWASIIPVYNMIVMLRVVKLDWWHIFIWLFVPFASIAYAIIVPIKLAKLFGKSSGFGVLAIFLPVIAYPILAFGQASYEG